MIEFYTNDNNLNKWSEMLKSLDVQNFIALLSETSRLDNSFPVKFSGLLRSGNPDIHEILVNSIQNIQINTDIIKDLVEDLFNPQPPEPSDLPPPSKRLLSRTD